MEIKKELARNNLLQKINAKHGTTSSSVEKKLNEMAQEIEELKRQNEEKFNQILALLKKD